MFHLLLLVYVMILDKIYFWKISTDDDIEKINNVGRQLGSAGAFRPDHRLPDCVVESVTVLSFKNQLDKFLSGRRFDLDQIY